ncbi:MAG: hypothetical protein IJX53_03330 [Clostridia bacterium]|nr:hypothetical protein [Clostridia bacterium]
MNNYINASDHLPIDGSRDVSADIQRLIEANPNRTIYFPDGTYLLAHPICTPADPRRSVDLRLSNYATLKAAEGWNTDEGAMVHLGGIYPANDIRTCGSNYGFVGGIIDGSNIADGISIDGGRETVIREVSIKHVRVGIHIKRGANSGSSDADIMSVNIVGNRAPDSVGVLVEGYDNTFTNLRIADVFIGVKLRAAGNFLRYLHPLYTLDYTDYLNSCGFQDESGNNWYDNCYSDQFGIGFRNTKTMTSIYNSCYCYWYAARGGTQTAFKADAQFGSVLTNFRADFRREEIRSVLLDVAEAGGKGVFDRLITKPELIADDTYRAYVKGDII